MRGAHRIPGGRDQATVARSRPGPAAVSGCSISRTTPPTRGLGGNGNPNKCAFGAEPGWAGRCLRPPGRSAGCGRPPRRCPGRHPLRVRRRAPGRGLQPAAGRPRAWHGQAGGTGNKEREVWHSDEALRVEDWIQVRGEEPGALLPPVEKDRRTVPLPGTRRLTVAAQREHCSPRLPAPRCPGRAAIFQPMACAGHRSRTYPT